MFSVADLSVNFGGVQALSSLNLEVPHSTIHGLIGPNGAGKSTALHAMTGVVVPDRGTVRLNGTTVTGMPPHRLLEVGLTRTFQQAQLWSGMSVLQNLTVPLLGKGRRTAEERAKEVAATLGFSDLLFAQASDLPFGARRLVEVGRAMMSDPAIVLLDEPGAGLTISEKETLVRVLQALSASGTSVLLVDHDMDVVMSACQLVTVLDAGSVIAEGTPAAIRTDPTVLAVYLGHN